MFLIIKLMWFLVRAAPLSKNTKPGCREVDAVHYLPKALLLSAHLDGVVAFTSGRIAKAARVPGTPSAPTQASDSSHTDVTGDNVVTGRKPTEAQSRRG